ncbi:probable E3 ubiquitin-protein ligase RHG1A isoform X1 [Olea europaea var. sylvestris]|uniref:probable E3 ubiquitin-protein ligase RHG1A isoform X1 n=2 Tax=Olea europaea var. sylvestris TaxID=158386 RepID=UPI000C1D5CCE|nr:probable E3 ubiquitin-protein ligase RHG1A isoform X1 [Olea europaea var. sylvestris]
MNKGLIQHYMDGYSGKITARGVVPKKGSGIALKDIANSTDQSTEFCLRLGCSGRIKYTQITENGSSVKAKCLRPSVHSSNDKKIIENPPRTCPVATNSKKPGPDSKRKFSSQLDINPSESSASGETLDPMPSPSRTRTAHHSESRDAKTRKGTMMDAGSSRVTSTIRSRKLSNRNSGSCSENNQLDSILPVSESSGLMARNSIIRSRYGLRSLKCNAVSDVIPQSCSTLDSKPNTKDIVKKGNPRGKSISSPGLNQTTAASFAPSTSGISISNPRTNRSWARREGGNGDASVSARRFTNINTTPRRSNQHNENSSSLREPVVRISELPLPGLPVDAGGHNSSQHFSTNVPSIGSSSYSLSSSDGNNLSSVMPVELGITHLMGRMTLQRLNISGIAELLLAIGRLEQDEDLNSEHVSALGISLLSGLSHYYDQHRDMRLDIDNMSYEELLALEERIGTVSTALSEEELSKCLRKSSYQAISSEVRDTGSLEDDNDTKCCICQEEYEFGNEIGTLGCQHGYHMACVVQWLRLKNWCPICKVSASPSQRS